MAPALKSPLKKPVNAGEIFNKLPSNWEKWISWALTKQDVTTKKNKYLIFETILFKPPVNIKVTKIYYKKQKNN